MDCSKDCSMDSPGTLKDLHQYHNAKKNEFFNTQTYLWSNSHISTWLLRKPIVVVQSLIHDQLFVIPWTEEDQASLTLTISQSLLKLLPIVLMMPSNHFILCCPLLILLSIFLGMRVFSNESGLPVRWQKYSSFSFNISPSKEYSGLISFRIDLFDPLAVQGTLKSLLKHHNSKASVLQCSAFFMNQL